MASDNYDKNFVYISSDGSVGACFVKATEAGE
jgi:hypothetical protein